MLKRFHNVIDAFELSKEIHAPPCSSSQVQCQKAESNPIYQAGKRAHRLLPLRLPVKLLYLSPSKPVCGREGRGLRVIVTWQRLREFLWHECTVWWDFTLPLVRWCKCQAVRRVNGNVAIMTNRSLFLNPVTHPSLTYHTLCFPQP